VAKATPFQNGISSAPPKATPFQKKDFFSTLYIHHSEQGFDSELPVSITELLLKPIASGCLRRLVFRAKAGMPWHLL
jgi:hypothetical protein